MAAVVKTEKRLDIAHAPTFEKELNRAFEDGETDIIVDMEETSYISSVILRALLKAQKKVNSINGSLILRNVSDSVMEVFDVTGFSGILMFEDQV